MVRGTYSEGPSDEYDRDEIVVPGSSPLMCFWMLFFLLGRCFAVFPVLGCVMGGSNVGGEIDFELFGERRRRLPPSLLVSVSSVFLGLSERGFQVLGCRLFCELGVVCQSSVDYFIRYWGRSG